MPDYPNIDVRKIGERLSRRTKVILPVHFGGAPCDMEAVLRLAESCGAAVVEDAAHALPAWYQGRRIGTIGRATAFSFYAGKNMTTGEGGMVTTADEELAEGVRRRRLHGISRDAWKRYAAEGSWYYEVVERGFKYNMADLNAAIGIHQLRKLDGFHRRRLELVRLYDELLQEVPAVKPLRPAEPENSAWHLYIIELELERLRYSRNDVIEALKADNIGTSVHFIPVHHHPYYRRRYGWAPHQCPEATRRYERTISLPLFPAMRDEDVRAVTRSLRRILTEALK